MTEKSSSVFVFGRITCKEVKLLNAPPPCQHLIRCETIISD